MKRKKLSPSLRHSTKESTQQHDQTASGSSQLKSSHLTVDVTKKKITLSEQQITELIVHNRLVKAYRRDIYRLCSIVYGNERALQEKVEEIQKNPVMGEDLIWYVALHPKSFAKLAGSNKCGVKDETRQRAENNVTLLCEAIENFVKVVKYARECLHKFTGIELKRYQKLLDDDAFDKILQSSHRDKEERKSLLDEEVMDLVKQNSTVQRYRAQIVFWSKIVFGKPSALQTQMEDILKTPSVASELIMQLQENPRSISGYAGTNVCGLKNKARRHAEAGLSHLVEAVGNLAHAAKQAKEGILQNHRAQQEHYEPSTEEAASLRQQQILPQDSHSSQHLQASTHHGILKSSRETHEREGAQSAQPRKTRKPKMVTFAS